MKKLGRVQMDGPTRRVGIVIPETLFERVYQRAKRERRAVSQWMRVAVEDTLDAIENQERDKNTPSLNE